MIKAADIHTGFDWYTNNEKIRQKLKSYMYLKDYVHSIFIILKDKKVCSNDAAFDDYYSQETASEWYMNFEKRKVNSGFSEKHLLFNRSRNGPNEVISYIVNIIDLDNPPDIIGVLVLDISSDYFSEFINESQQYSKAYMLLNADNHVLFSKGYMTLPMTQDIHPAGEEISFAENREGIITVNQSMNDNWSLISLTSKKQLFGQAQLYCLSCPFFYFLLAFWWRWLYHYTGVGIFVSPVFKADRCNEGGLRGNLNVHMDVQSGD